MPIGLNWLFSLSRSVLEVQMIFWLIRRKDEKMCEFKLKFHMFSLWCGRRGDEYNHHLFGFLLRCLLCSILLSNTQFRAAAADDDHVKWMNIIGEWIKGWECELLEVKKWISAIYRVSSNERETRGDEFHQNKFYYASRRTLNIRSRILFVD